MTVDNLDAYRRRRARTINPPCVMTSLVDGTGLAVASGYEPRLDARVALALHRQVRGVAIERGLVSEMPLRAWDLFWAGVQSEVN